MFALWHDANRASGSGKFSDFHHSLLIGIEDLHSIVCLEAVFIFLAGWRCSALETVKTRAAKAAACENWKAGSCLRRLQITVEALFLQGSNDFANRFVISALATRVASGVWTTMQFFTPSRVTTCVSVDRTMQS